MKTTDERRRCYRYPPIQGGETAVLRCRGAKHQGKLVNLSAEGFRLQLETDPAAEVGDVAILATSNDEHWVRVANTCRENDVIQVGLQRLEEKPAFDLTSGSASVQRPDRRLGVQFFSNFEVPIPLAICGVVVLVAAVILWRMQDPKSKDGDAKSKVGAARARSNDSQPRQKQGRSDSSEVASADRGSGAGSASAAAKKDRDREAARRPTRAERQTSTPSRSLFGDNTTTKTARQTGLQAGGSRPAGEPGPSLASSTGAVESVLPSHRNGSPQSFVFNSQRDAAVEIDSALRTASRENKRVLVEFGNNECQWCRLLHDAFVQDSDVAAMLKNSFVLVLVDVGANRKLYSQYVREGDKTTSFLTVLDKEGRVLRNQKTEEFANGASFDVAKVKAFLAQWSFAALSPHRLPSIAARF